jgi:hypothetical protein
MGLMMCIVRVEADHRAAPSRDRPAGSGIERGFVMRAFLLSMVAAFVALFVLTPTVAAGAAPAAQLKVEHKTSAIYQYDPSPFGGGPLYDTVTVYTRLRHCPVGNYLLSMTLVQDGVSYPLASTALGVGEFSCTATDTEPQVSMAFYGNGLHPGTAVASVGVYGEEDGVPLIGQQTGSVRIPKGYDQP